MKKFLLLAPCVMLAAACSGGAGNNGGAATNNSGAATTAANSAGPATDTGVTADAGTGDSGAATLRPGQWEMTASLTNIEIPGAPPQAAEQMKAQMGRQQTQTQCLTQEEVSNIAEKLANASSQGANCNFSRRTFAGGTIDVAGTCQSPQGQMEMTMTGAFTPETMNMNMDMNVTGGPQTMRMSLTTTGRRIGDCPA